MRTGAALEQHLEYLRARNLRPSTITQRRYALRRLARYVDHDLLDATRDELAAFLARRRERTLHGEHLVATSPASQLAELNHLRGFYQWAYDEGLSDDPTRRLPRPRLPHWHPRPMPDSDVDMALRLAPADRVAPILHCAAGAGLRAISIAHLRPENIDWERRTILYEAKGGHTKIAAMTTACADALLMVEPKWGWMFPLRDGRPDHLPNHMISRIANQYLHGLGIEHTLHTLRHWHLTRFYGESLDIRLTQEQAGHDAITSTQRYTKVDQTQAVGVLDRMTPILA